MGVYAHATHLFVPDRDTGKVVAGALLKSPHSLVISRPYGSWINAYLEPGVSYKDVKEFPTTSHVELNCYDSEGFDVRLFTRDRLAFLYENGAGDLGEEEDRLLEIASDLWAKENPDAAAAADKAGKDRADSLSAAPARTGNEPSREALGFFGLTPAEQEEYVKKAGASPDDEDALQKAADLWAKENPEKAEATREAARRAAEEERSAEESSEPGEVKQVPGFWGLPKDEQDKWIAEARKSGVFEKYVTTVEEQEVPSCDDFAPFLPEGRTAADLHHLLAAMTGRMYGPPESESDKAVIEKWMEGKNHSEKAEDYVAAIGRFLGVRGSLWSLESIQEQLADKIDRRIVPVEELDNPPAEASA